MSGENGAQLKRVLEGLWLASIVRASVVIGQVRATSPEYVAWSTKRHCLEIEDFPMFSLARLMGALTESELFYKELGGVPRDEIIEAAWENLVVLDGAGYLPDYVRPAFDLYQLLGLVPQEQMDEQPA